MLYVPSGSKGHRELAVKVVREQERLDRSSKWNRVRDAYAVLRGRASALRVEEAHE